MRINKLNLIRISAFTLLLILKLTLFQSTYLHAQSPNFRFKSIFKEDGLSSNTINGIVKDKLGFLWIATNNGLCRYDAKGRMKVFQEDVENNRLHSSTIECIYNDSNGFLWIGTRQGGLTKIDVGTDIWTTYRHNPDDTNSVAHDEILCITEDDEGKIWIGTEDGVNILYPEEERFVTFRVNKSDPIALQGKSVLSLLQDKNGLMWVGTWGGGLHLFLPDENDIAKSNFRNFMIPGKNAHTVIWEICQDTEGRYWIGEEIGLTYMQIPADASDEVLKQNWDLNFHLYQQEDISTSRRVFSILNDSRGNLWFSSIEGLKLIRQEFLPDTTIFLRSTPDKPKFPVQTFLGDEDNVFSISTDDIYCLYEDDQGLIWIGTPKGLSQFNWRTRQFEFIEMGEGSRVDASIMTLEGILFMIDKSPYIHIYDLKKDSIKRFTPPQSRIYKEGFLGAKNNQDGTICILASGGIGVYDIKTNTYLHELIFEDKPQYFDDAFMSAYMFYQDKIWVGGSKGLTVFDTKLNKVKNYRSSAEDKQSLATTAISDFKFDNEHNLWISTWGGISILSKAQLDLPRLPEIFKFTNHIAGEAGNGFISNKIVTIQNSSKRMYIGSLKGLISYEYDSQEFIDRTNQEHIFPIYNIHDWVEDEIWMSTGEGIINYNAQTKTYKKYHNDYGINNISLLYSKSYKDNEGRLYFTGEKTIIRLAPDELLENETPPVVSITDARILNTKKEKSFSTINIEEIKLQHGDYLLALSFSALNYDSPEKNRFAYRLEGLDNNWTYTKSTEPIVFTSLDAGNYTFTVKAANNDGVWNDKGASLKIIKKPAYWETKIFKVVVILLIILAVLWAVRIYNKTLRNRYKEIASYNKKLNTEITERKKAEETLQIKNEELINTNKDLEQFAYICSHDLNEPIRGIHSFVNLVERKTQIEPLKEEVTPYFGYIYNYLRTLQNIITSLGIFTRVNQGENFTHTPVLISDVFKKVEANLMELVREKNAVLSFNDLTTHETIYSSEYALILVLQNLVQNGLKYNTSTPPKISVNATFEDQHLLISITDNGIGIKEEYFEYIFKPFKTLENKSKTNSSGLGLAICNRIINQLGGKIWVKSVFGEGSTFYLTLEKHHEKKEREKNNAPI